MRTLITLALLGFALLSYAQDQQPPATNGAGYVLKVQSDLVLTNVVVRDKRTGAVVRGLTAKDFTVLENGKPQTIQTFDFQSAGVLVTHDNIGQHQIALHLQHVAGAVGIGVVRRRLRLLVLRMQHRQHEA